MQPVRVRAARSDDLPALTALYNHYVKTSPATFDLEPVTVEARAQWMARYADTGPHRLLVATVDDAIAGHATSGKAREKPGKPPSGATPVYVAPGRQGRGVGTSLYTALFAQLAKEDVHRVFAAIVPPNPASVALHARFGFVPVGCFHEAGRKFGRYWDVEWFERTIP